MFALDHHVERLAEDHARARQLAEAFATVRPDVVDPDAVETNIVVLDLTKGPDAKMLAGAALEQGVAVSVLGPRTARLVTHMDVDDDGIERAVDVLTALLSG
jgi:threonine aldolase